MFKKYETNLYNSKIKSLKKKWLYKEYEKKRRLKLLPCLKTNYKELIYIFPKEDNKDIQIEWIDYN